MIHNNQPLLWNSYFKNSATALCGSTSTYLSSLWGRIWHVMTLNHRYVSFKGHGDESGVSTWVTIRIPPNPPLLMVETCNHVSSKGEEPSGSGPRNSPHPKWDLVANTFFHCVFFRSPTAPHAQSHIRASGWLSRGLRVPVQEELPRPHTLSNGYVFVLRDGQAMMINIAT